MTTKPKQTATLGTVSGTPLVVDLNGGDVGTAGGDPWALRKVTLSANYTAVNLAGLPDRPPAGGPTPWAPGLILSGTTRYFHAHEAAALVAAGAATYA